MMWILKNQDKFFKKNWESIAKMKRTKKDNMKKKWLKFTQKSGIDLYFWKALDNSEKMKWKQTQDTTWKSLKSNQWKEANIRMKRSSTNNMKKKEEEPLSSLQVNIWLKMMTNMMRMKMEITNTREGDMTRRISNKNIWKMED